MTDRRSVLALLAGVALAGAGRTLAQDPRASLAQQVALAWLAIADRGDAPTTWNASSPLFQKSIDAARWTEALEKVRKPLGAVVSRTLTSTQVRDELPQLPRGEYVLLIYRTEFAAQPSATERVTVARDSDGTWRVAGYLIG